MRLQVSRRYDAPPGRVFDAWLDPATARQFLFKTPKGEMVTVEIDPRVAGRFTIVERRDGKDQGHYGRYVEIDRPRRLSFDFSTFWDFRDAGRVTVDIAPDGGGSVLTLTNEFDDKLAEHAEKTRRGWNTILESLAKAL